jgi:hypothetical protein
MFGDSALMYHQEIETENKRIWHKGAFSTEYEELQRFRREHGVGYHELCSRGESLQPSLINIAHMGSPSHERLFPDLRCNAPKICDMMLAMHGLGNAYPLPKKGDHWNHNELTQNPTLNIDTGEDGGLKHMKNGVTQDEIRGTLSCNLGFGHQCANDKFPKEHCGTVASAPILIGCGVTCNPIQRAMYKEIGGVMDACQNWMDYDCKTSTAQFNDERRNHYFGKMLADAMGAEFSRFEAATVNLADTGPADNRKKLKKALRKHILLRHTDGPNDSRPGYDKTVVFYMMMEYRGRIWRLTFICYSRSKCGGCMETEDTIAQPSMQLLRKYRDNVRPHIYYNLRSGMLDKQETFNTAQHHKKRQKTSRNTFVPKTDSIKYWTTTPAISPEGWFSAFTDGILHLRDQYKWDYRRTVELFYVACIACSSPVLFTLVTRRWMKGGASELRCNKKTGKISCVNGKATCGTFIRLYYEECVKMGLNGPENGPVPRFQYGGALLLTDNCTEKTCIEAVDNMIKKIELVNTKWDQATTLTELIKRGTPIDTPGFGTVTSLSFYGIGVQLGLLHTDWARKNSFKASMHNRNSYAKYAIKHWKATSDQAQRVFKRLCLFFEIEPYIMENWTCKAARWEIGEGKKHPDVYFEGQRLFFKSKKMVDGIETIVLETRLLEEQDWTEYNPKIEEPNQTRNSN